MVCFALVQASHSMTTVPCHFAFIFSCPMNLKLNAAFYQPVISVEAFELSVPFVLSHPQRTDLSGQENKKLKKERKKKILQKEVVLLLYGYQLMLRIIV